MVVDPFKALEPGAPVLRTDKPGKTDNRIFHWEVGDRAATDRVFRDAAVTVKEAVRTTPSCWKSRYRWYVPGLGTAA